MARLRSFFRLLIRPTTLPVARPVPTLYIPGAKVADRHAPATSNAYRGR